MSSLYERRVEQEWRLLQTLAGENRDRLEILDREQATDGEILRLALHQTQGIVKQGPDLTLSNSHFISLHFPEFFPSTPIEASLALPVFHPNVHPENGFVCLWNRFYAGDTVMEAVSQLQRVISWHLVNEQRDHLLQPDSLAWYLDPTRVFELPLKYEPIRKPRGFQMERTYGVRPTGNYRRRLY